MGDFIIYYYFFYIFFLFRHDENVPQEGAKAPFVNPLTLLVREWCKKKPIESVSMIIPPTPIHLTD